jgi:hypothetical protein
LLGFLVSVIAFRHGFTLADNWTLLIAELIAAAWALVSLIVDRFRMVVIMSVGVCCGVSLCVGVLAGTILTVTLAVIYAVVTLQYLYWQRRSVSKQVV